VLRVSELPDPVPGKREVVVRVRALGVDYAEIQSRRGLYGWAPRLPYVRGVEACGEIVVAGVEASASRIGERFVVGAQSGCYADLAAVPETQALPALESCSDEENAAFPECPR
jgi:NADPH2:quinone reductase